MATVLERTAPVEVTAIEDAPLPISSEQFKQLSHDYPDLRMEMTAEGELIVMPPTFGKSGRRNFIIAGQLAIWSQVDNTGEGFDSNTGFRLPSGATRAPDAAWVKRSRWDALSPEVQENEFVPLAPDFVLELRSRTDRLSTLQKKMQEYRDNGVRLGWLIDPRLKRVEIYRTGREAEVLDNPQSLSGEDVLPGFTLNLTEIFA